MMMRRVRKGANHSVVVAPKEQNKRSSIKMAAVSTRGEPAMRKERERATINETYTVLCQIQKRSLANTGQRDHSENKTRAISAPHLHF